MNKKILVLVPVLLTVTIGLATWLNFYQTNPIGYTITSEKPLTFTDYFTITSGDVTDNNISKTENITVNSKSGRTLNCTVTQNTTKTDTNLTDGCNLDGTMISVNTIPLNFAINKTQDRIVETTTSVEALTCPSNITTKLEINCVK
jgi:hypothetical protein